MRQQFQPEESAQQSHPIFSTPEKRYDSATVQQIIARATQLQVEHQDTLSAQQIEAIGAEVGLDSAFIRRALSEVESGSVSSQRMLSTSTVSTVAATRRIQRTRTAFTVCASISTLYAFFFFWLLEAAKSNNNVITACALFVPVFLALGLGAGVRGKRLGAMVGALLGTEIIFSVILNSMQDGIRMQLGPFFALWLALAMGGAAAGALGAAIRKHGPHTMNAFFQKVSPETPQLP